MSTQASDSDVDVHHEAPPPRPERAIDSSADDDDSSSTHSEQEQEQKQQQDSEENNNEEENASPSSSSSSASNNKKKDDETSLGGETAPSSGEIPSRFIYENKRLEEIRSVWNENPTPLSKPLISFFKGTLQISLDADAAAASQAAGDGGDSTASPNFPTQGAGAPGFFGRSGSTPNTAQSGGGFPNVKGNFKDPNNLRAGSSSGPEAFSREGMFADVKVNQAAIKERTLLHRIRGIFAKVSIDNYPSMKLELCALPIRQSRDDEVKEIVHWIYDKAIQPEDEIYVDLYANLIRDMIQDIAAKDKKKGHALKGALIEKCQASFEKRTEVARAAKTGEGRMEATETTVGTQDSAAAAALKAAIAHDGDDEYVRQRDKVRLRSNIKFLAQLFRVQMVTGKVVNFVLYTLLYGSAHGTKHRPEEYEIEMFCDLIKTVQVNFPADLKKQYFESYFATIREHSASSKTSMRVRCLLQDLLDLVDNNWMTRAERKSKGLITVGPNATVPIPSPTTASSSSSAPYSPATQQQQQQQHSNLPTPPYSPNTLQQQQQVPPAYPGRGGGGGRGGSGSGTGSPNVPLPLGGAPMPNAQQQMHLAARHHHQQAAVHQQVQQQQHSNLPTKEMVITTIQSYKDNGNNPQYLLDHFRYLPDEMKMEHLLHWLGKIVKIVRKEDERKLACSVLQVLSENRMIHYCAGLPLMARLAPQVAQEYEDNPKIFISWSQILQMQWITIIPPSVHVSLLKELVKTDAPFSTIEQMITDIQSSSSTWIFPNSNDIPLYRFRMLPTILSCTRDSSGDDDEDDGDFSMNAGGSSYLAGGSGSNVDEPSHTGSMRADSSTATGGAGGGSNSNVMEEEASSAISKKDLLSYLLSHPTHPRQETQLATEIEIDIFGTLVSTDLSMNQRINMCLKKAKQHPQRSEVTFVAGFICAIFCYLRIAAAVGDRSEMDKFRDILKELRVPGENMQLFLRECYMCQCEFGGLPHSSFAGMLTMISSHRDYLAEKKNFDEWNKKQHIWIGNTVGIHPKKLPPNTA